MALECVQRLEWNTGTKNALSKEYTNFENNYNEWMKLNDLIKTHWDQCVELLRQLMLVL